jgi:hypothetical protein
MFDDLNDEPGDAMRDETLPPRPFEAITIPQIPDNAKSYRNQD